MNDSYVYAITETKLYIYANNLPEMISNDIDIQGSAGHTVNRTGNRPPDVVRNGQLFECLYDRLYSQEKSGYFHL